MRLTLGLLFAAAAFAQAPVQIQVGPAAEGPWRPVWRFFGYDEPNYTYMKDGKKLLSEIAALSPHTVHVRVHNLLTTGDGKAALKWGSTNAYTEDANGKPVYNWTIVDRIFDTFVERKMKPLVEIGFMPQALSVKPEPYQHHWDPAQKYQNIYTGWAQPSKDYAKWSELVYQWVKHSVARYGKAEVESWYWEVWNEPDIGYWQSTPEEYFKLYDYSADAVKRALPGIRIGGPTTTGPGSEKAAAFLRAFLDHVVKGRNFATGENRRPARLHQLPRQRPPHRCRWARPHGKRQADERRVEGLRNRGVLPHSEETPHHHRGIGSRRLCGMLRALQPAERLSQRDHVFQLHRRHLRAEKPVGHAPWDQLRRRRYLGL